MLKFKLIAILIFSIAVIQPSFSQQLKLKENSPSLLSQNETFTKNKYISNDLSVIMHIGVGGDFGSYFAFGYGLTIGYADIIDAEINYDKCSQFDVTGGGGNGESTNVLSLRGFGTLYLAKGFVKLSVGAGTGIITNRPSYPVEARNYFIFSAKVDVFFNKFVGMGLDWRLGNNYVYEKSMSQIMLNFNFRPFKEPVF